MAGVGPILPRPIDTVGRDRLGYLMGAGLETRGLNYFAGVAGGATSQIPGI